MLYKTCLFWSFAVLFWFAFLLKGTNNIFLRDAAKFSSFIPGNEKAICNRRENETYRRMALVFDFFYLWFFCFYRDSIFSSDGFICLPRFWIFFTSFLIIFINVWHRILNGTDIIVLACFCWDSLKSELSLTLWLIFVTDIIDDSYIIHYFRL